MPCLDLCRAVATAPCQLLLARWREAVPCDGATTGEVMEVAPVALRLWKYWTQPGARSTANDTTLQEGRC